MNIRGFDCFHMDVTKEQSNKGINVVSAACTMYMYNINLSMYKTFTQRSYGCQYVKLSFGRRSIFPILAIRYERFIWAIKLNCIYLNKLLSLCIALAWCIFARHVCAGACNGFCGIALANDCLLAAVTSKRKHFIRWEGKRNANKLAWIPFIWTLISH